MSVLNISRLQRESHGGIVAHQWVVAIYHLNDKDTHRHSLEHGASAKHNISIYIMQVARHALLWRNPPNVLIMSQCVFATALSWLLVVTESRTDAIASHQYKSITDRRGVRDRRMCATTELVFLQFFPLHFRVSAVAAFGSCVTCPYIRCGFSVRLKRLAICSHFV